MMDSDASLTWDCPRCLRKNPAAEPMCHYCGSDRLGRKLPAQGQESESSEGRMENSTKESQRFSTLLGFGQIFSLVGWVIVAVGAILFVLGLNEVGKRSLFSSGVSLLDLVIGLLVAVIGFTLVAGGQAISCFVSIERNTHSILLLQQAVLGSRSSGIPKSTVREDIRAAATSQAEKGELRTKPVVDEPMQGPPAKGRVIACPGCQESEAIQENKRYDPSQYTKFDAVIKSSLGFQKVLLACRKCRREFSAF